MDRVGADELRIDRLVVGKLEGILSYIRMNSWIRNKDDSYYYKKTEQIKL